MEEKYIKVLGNSYLFRDMIRDEIEKMLLCLNPTINKYEKNELITREGDFFESLGLLLKGKANVIKEKASGARVVMTMLHEGDVFGEMAAFSDINKWPATVQCIEKCTVMFIPKINIIGECEKMCPWHRRLITNFVKIVSVKALMLSNKVEYLTIKSMRGKISAFLFDEYKRNNSFSFTIHLNRNEMADFLNVSRPSMSRELIKMKEEGIIDFHLSSFKIKDLDKLKNQG